MKIGVVGASGTLGRVTVASILDQMHDMSVVGLVRRPDAELSAIPRCHLMTGGLFDFEALDELAQSCDVIVNLAARNPEGQEKDLVSRQQFLLTNGLGAAAVAGAAARHNKPLLHFSTVAVYETGSHRAGAYLEEDEELPAGDDVTAGYFENAVQELKAVTAAERGSAGAMERWEAFCNKDSYPSHSPVYGLTKLIGERSVLDMNDNVLCVRMCDVYGPGHESRGVITDHLSALKSANRVQVNFDFRKTVSYIYIQDVVDFIGLATRSLLVGAKLPRVLNLVGDAIDESDFYTQLIELRAAAGANFEVLAADARADTYDRRYSRDLFKSSFPSAPDTKLVNGLQRTWANI